GNDNATNAALFGFSGSPDFDDASRNVAEIDQGGFALPGRSFYLDDDAKAKEIRAKYLKHIANIFALSGDKPEQAKAGGRCFGHRDRPRQNRHGPRGTPRSQESQQQNVARGDQGANAFV